MTPPATQNVGIETAPTPAGHDLIRLRPRADRVTLSNGETVLSSDLCAQIEPEEECGLFVQDTRVISRYRCRANGRHLGLVAQSHVNQHRWLGYFLVLPEADTTLRDAAQDSIELRWSRVISGGLHEDFDIVNYSDKEVRFRLSLQWEADFADLEETQSDRRQYGRLRSGWTPSSDGGEWRADYRMARRWRHQGNHGRASIERSVTATIRCDSGKPGHRNGRIVIDLVLRPHQSWHACVDWEVTIDGLPHVSPACPCASAPQESQAPSNTATDAYLRESTAFASHESRTLASVVIDSLERSRRDLASLRLQRLDRGPSQWTVAAGAPTYASFFGRDSILAAWQSAVLGPELLDGTLPQLQETQGTRSNDWRDEQPGRMLHEARTGPIAALRYKPSGRYYGALNSSTLFPIALLQLWKWTGDRARIAPLLPAAVDTMRWLDREAREGHDGFYAYRTRSRQGLDNQSWKDSGDALVNPDGSKIEQPAASCEEQAQSFRAKLALAELLADFGREDDARVLHAQALDLQQRFENAYWSDEQGYYALAIDRHGRAVYSTASNPMHCLATGIAAPERAQAVMQRLLREDLFSGWGIRTLSSEHCAYNPYAYHRGTVWPAEHGPLAFGAMRYGLVEPAQRICRAQFEAAALFDHRRLPECFAGHPRDAQHPFPALYPYTNAPQAWSATTVLSLLQAMLGLSPVAYRSVLTVAPHLPDWLPQIDLTGLRVGEAVVDLRFSRRSDGHTDFEVLDQRGQLSVVRRASDWEPLLDFDRYLEACRSEDQSAR
jgi:glycogen debranching enzyme